MNLLAQCICTFLGGGQKGARGGVGGGDGKHQPYLEVHAGKPSPSWHS